MDEPQEQDAPLVIAKSVPGVDGAVMLLMIGEVFMLHTADPERDIPLDESYLELGPDGRPRSMTLWGRPVELTRTQLSDLRDLIDRALLR